MIETEEIEANESAIEVRREHGPAARWVEVVGRLIYPAALVVALSMWFFAIRAPLWLDEMLSYWQVSGGFAKVWSRSALMPSSIGYLYTLWCAKSILGTSEIALKIPSTIALLAAVYFLYRAARELFGEEIAYLACIFFVLQGNVVFAATDARPYAFALLATTVATFAFVRWMERMDSRHAFWFGASVAAILYFHYLFATIVPVFAIYYLIVRGRFLRRDFRQLAVALGAVTLLCIPLIYRVAELWHNRGVHIVPELRHPVLSALNNLAPKQILIGFVAATFLAALVRKLRVPERESFPAVLLGPLMALVPAGMLFGVSAATGMHLVISRYFSVVAPGSALTWALLAYCIDSRVLRRILCIGIVGFTVVGAYTSAFRSWHEVNFKKADAFVNGTLARQDVTVLECSAFIESNYQPLPTDRDAEDALNSQIFYYPVNGPVVMLPMSLGDETVRIAGPALSEAAERHRSVLVVVGGNSYDTITWLANYTRGAFRAEIVERGDQVLVAEFQPF